MTDEQRYNEIIRAGAQTGVNIIDMLERDLDEAMIKYDRVKTSELAEYREQAPALKGRVRGLAQALATVRSPFSRSTASGGGQPSKYWAQVILGEEASSRLRIKAQSRVSTKGK